MDQEDRDNGNSGLASPEVMERRALYGFNELSKGKRRPVLEFLKRYWGPMPWLLELAIALSLLLGHDLEAAIIFLLLSVNAVIGFRNSNESRKALELLSSRLAPSARVLRDGEWKTLPARELVPDDVIALRLGEVAPADGVILSGALSVDQSALTGESLPTDLSAGDRFFSSSPIRRGEALCRIEKTGDATYIGQTARLMESARPKSHQEEVMLEIVRYMMYIGMTASVLVAIYAFIIKTDPLVNLTFVVIFLMGAIPVALPAVLSIVQSVGAVELSRKGVLVSRLEAIEDAASIDTICFDKTGTLTRNELAVAGISPLSGISEEQLLLHARLASASVNPDTIDATILTEAARTAITTDGYTQLSFTPFDPITKRTEAIVAAPDGGHLRVTKGAIDSVLGLCAAPGNDASVEIAWMVEEHSSKGRRCIAVATGKEGDALRFLGILALSDPPRADSRAMIGELRSLGIRPVMLTGDAAPIARQVALDVGIGDRILDASTLDGLDDDTLGARIEESDGVAGVFPQHKYAVIRALQSRGHRTGMTGDGVNDAPALRQSEVGIAVYGASDVAKSSASLVLTEPGLAVIVHAIETSRQIYQRMLSWVINKVTKVLSFTGFLAAAFVWLRELPISLLGMSLLVFSNDFATMSIATDHVVHTTEPNSWEVKTIIKASIVPGLFYMLQALGAVALGLYVFHLEPDRLKTLVLLDLVFSSQFRVLSVRERGHIWESRPGAALLRTSVLVVLAFGVMGAAGFLMPALPLMEVFWILLYSAAASFATDFPKQLSFRKYSL